MHMRPRSSPRIAADATCFGRRASDLAFASAPGAWFGRRSADRKAKTGHSLGFATQLAAQIAEQASPAKPATIYERARSARAGLVKDFKT